MVNGSPLITSIALLPDGIHPLLPDTKPTVPKGSNDLHIAPTVDDGTPPSTITGKIGYSYITNLATAYADQYALNYNGTYRYFPGFPDCAPFVSQCLLAANRPMVGGDKTAPNAWWYTYGIVGDQSYSWGGASNLFTQMTSYSSNFIFVAYTTYVQPGDVVFADWNSTGTIDHVMIVSERICSGGPWACILIDQHTDNRLRFPLSSTLALQPNASFYVIRPIF
jgi:hypothetical protein